MVHTRLFTVVVAAALVASVASCSDDATPANDAVSTREEWCAVIADVDVKFTATDSSSDAIAIKKKEYAEIGVLLDQLAASVEVEGVVEPDARADVLAAMEFTQGLTDTWAAVPDDATQAELEALFTPVFETEVDLTPAAEYILAECGVDIDG